MLKVKALFMAIKDFVVLNAFRFGRFVVAKSPYILAAVGICLTIAAAVSAYKAAPKMKVVIERTKAEKAAISENLTAKEIREEKFDISAKAVVSSLRVMLPTIIFVVGSIAAWFGALGILNHRLGVAGAALASVTEEYATYRSRVIAEEGPDKDMEYMTGLKQTGEIAYTDEEGILHREPTYSYDGKKMPYSIIFSQYNEDGSYNCMYTRDNSCNRMAAQAWTNILDRELQAGKVVTWNEVRNQFGESFTAQGQVDGWSIDKYPGCHVESEIINVPELEAEGKLLIRFNCPGSILDYMDKKQNF